MRAPQFSGGSSWRRRCWAKARLLGNTHGRLFVEPMTPRRAALLRTDDALAERVDGFIVNRAERLGWIKPLGT